MIRIEMIRVHISISGVVQGVGFRFYTSRLAGKTNITGYVRNLANGSVEVEAEGTESAVAAFVSELKTGPRHASISGFTMERLNPLNYKSFDIR